MTTVQPEPAPVEEMPSTAEMPVPEEGTIYAHKGYVVMTAADYAAVFEHVVNARQGGANGPVSAEAAERVAMMMHVEVREVRACHVCDAEAVATVAHDGWSAPACRFCAGLVPHGATITYWDA